MVLTVMQHSLITILLVAAPPLIIALVVGLAVSIFQTITSINEQTLTFVPKIVGVFLSLIIFGPFMMSKLQDLFIYLFSNLAMYIK